MGKAIIEEPSVPAEEACRGAPREHASPNYSGVHVYDQGIQAISGRKGIMTFSYLWALPQNMVGLMVLKYLQHKKAIESQRGSELLESVNIYFVDSELDFAGVSLGVYIFIGGSYPDVQTAIMHEEGHCLQSMILGPLYLLVVGIPSVIMNIMSAWSLKHGDGAFYNNYYKRWPESWADKLGKVDR
jgi:hypothetical protein